MAPWTCKSAHCFPRAVGMIMIFGMIIVFVIAVVRHDVSPYVPFISEAGAKPPEAGIFSLFLDITATVGMITIILRYMIVEEINQEISKCMGLVNKISLVIGIISMLGMLVVAAYPMITVMSAHELGAMTLFIGSILYGVCHTWISYKMYPQYNGICICHTRLILMCLSIATFLTMSVVGPFAQRTWADADHFHWTGSKTPDDEGFPLMVTSAAAEWMMSFLFIGFFFTFIREFSKIAIHLNVHMLVSHFDEETPSRGNEETRLL